MVSLCRSSYQEGCSRLFKKYVHDSFWLQIRWTQSVRIVSWSQTKMYASYPLLLSLLPKSLQVSWSNWLLKLIRTTASHLLWHLVLLPWYHFQQCELCCSPHSDGRSCHFLLPWTHPVCWAKAFRPTGNHQCFPLGYLKQNTVGYVFSEKIQRQNQRGHLFCTVWIQVHTCICTAAVDTHICHTLLVDMMPGVIKRACVAMG